MRKKPSQVRISKENVDYLQRRFANMDLSISQMANTVIMIARMAKQFAVIEPKKSLRR